MSVNFEKYSSPRFELVLQMRDYVGKPIGQTKHFSTDDQVELEQFFVRNSFKEKKHEQKNRRDKPRGDAGPPTRGNEKPQTGQ
jgi:hypothetical protein